VFLLELSRDFLIALIVRLINLLFYIQVEYFRQQTINDVIASIEIY